MGNGDFDIPPMTVDQTGAIDQVATGDEEGEVNLDTVVQIAYGGLVEPLYQKALEWEKRCPSGYGTSCTNYVGNLRQAARDRSNWLDDGQHKNIKAYDRNPRNNVYNTAEIQAMLDGCAKVYPEPHEPPSR